MENIFRKIKFLQQFEAFLENKIFLKIVLDFCCNRIGFVKNNFNLIKNYKNLSRKFKTIS